MHHQPHHTEQQHHVPAQGGDPRHGHNLASAAVAPPPVNPNAFLSDLWLYRDPKGDVQGPFTKVDILDWFEAGFFPQVGFVKLTHCLCRIKIC